MANLSNSGNSITLSNASNDFATVAITSGNNVTLVDTNALALGASTVSGTLGVTTSGGGSCADPITENLYAAADTAMLPAEAVAASLGCGNPRANS